MKIIKLSLLSLASTLAFSFHANAATKTVTSMEDDGSNGTLRRIIKNADDGDVIMVPKGSILLTLEGAEALDADIYGGGLADNDADLDISKSLTIIGAGRDKTFISGNGAVTEDNVFSVDGGGDVVSLTLQDLTVRGGNATDDDNGDTNDPTSGGAIYLAVDANLTIRNVTVGGSNAEEYGGGIYAGTDSSVLVEDSSVDGNDSDSYGGGIYVEGDDGTLSVVGSTIQNNRANSYGGGMYVERGGFELVSSTVSQNEADGYGGGVFNYYGGWLMDNTVVSGNDASSEGGGVYTYYGSSLITDSTVKDNYSESYGGGIANYEGAALITNTKVKNNTAEGYGGGVYTYTLATIMDSVIDGNRAINGYEGGGIYNEYSANVINTKVTNNESEQNGAGIYNEYYMSVVGSEVSGNEIQFPDYEGGGIYNDYNLTVLDTDIASNSADSGGGIYSYYYLTVDNSSVRNNTANNGHGGGIYVESDSATIRSSAIHGNVAQGDDGSEDGSGGGIYYDGSDPSTVANSTISGNTADGHGGGIYGDTYGLLLANVTMTNNEADVDGGGLTAGKGGGVYVEDTIVTLRNSIMKGNKAPEGKECYTDTGTVFVQAANLIGSQADCDVFGETDNVFNDDPGLADLANNDGKGQGVDGSYVGKTMALASGSPAIDAAIGTTYKYDQRGVERDSSPDLGAYEYVSDSSDGDNSGGDNTGGDDTEDGGGGCSVATEGTTNGNLAVFGLLLSLMAILAVRRKRIS